MSLQAGRYLWQQMLPGCTVRDERPRRPGARHDRTEVAVVVSAPPTGAFHVGVRVVDLEQSMEDLGASLGLEWARLQERDQRLWTPEGGAITTPLRFTYSIEGPLHVELLQGRPGSIWDAGLGVGLHHTGVWSEDVKGDTDGLLGSGWTMVGAQRPPEDGYGTMTYVQAPTGFVLELVDVAVRPMFERWWAGGDLR
jgi:lactoylglutathione lyase